MGSDMSCIPPRLPQTVAAPTKQNESTITSLLDESNIESRNLSDCHTMGSLNSEQQSETSSRQNHAPLKQTPVANLTLNVSVTAKQLIPLTLLASKSQLLTKLMDQTLHFLHPQHSGLMNQQQRFRW